MAKTKAKRLLSLDTTTGETSDDAYFGLIIDTYTGQTLIQIEEAIFALCCLVELTDITICCEGVSLFVGLQRER